MKRWSYSVLVLWLLSFSVVSTVAPPVQAVTTYSLEAVTNVPQEWTNFSVIWTDDNQDGLFQLSEGEPGGFSGVTYLPFVMF